MKREVLITNRHPRLRFRRSDVARAVNLLDEQFRILPGDLRYLSISRLRLASLKSKIQNPKSKISPVPPGELSLVFLTDAALAKIHGDFMGDPTATDVITFEGDVSAGLAGEICVSADTAAKYVGLSLADRPARRHLSVIGQLTAEVPALQERFAAELTLYVVHGWMHLVGYDDLQPARKRRMRAAEARAMKVLRAAKAIPAFKIL